MIIEEVKKFTLKHDILPVNMRIICKHMRNDVIFLTIATILKGQKRFRDTRMCNFMMKQRILPVNLNIIKKHLVNELIFFTIYRIKVLKERKMQIQKSSKR
jgi:hypothetical protein